jgi:hypothetical protein
MDDRLVILRGHNGQDHIGRMRGVVINRLIGYRRVDRFS